MFPVSDSQENVRGTGEVRQITQIHENKQSVHVNKCNWFSLYNTGNTVNNKRKACNAQSDQRLSFLFSLQCKFQSHLRLRDPDFIVSKNNIYSSTSHTKRSRNNTDMQHSIPYGLFVH